MAIKQDLAAAVGNTPLIRLRKASELTGCEILGKAEFLNPGQSVKDRAALYIIKDAVAKGLLKPGGTIVEELELPNGCLNLAGGGDRLQGLGRHFRPCVVKVGESRHDRG